MNILFLTLTRKKSFNNRGIYTDLMRMFSRKDQIYAVCIDKKSDSEKCYFESLSENFIIVNCGVRDSKGERNKIKKGLMMVSLEFLLNKRLKKLLSDIHFDLIVYATPPITFLTIIQFIKMRDHAKTYLMLKDIFPQNAVDLGMMKKTGLKGLLYRYFRNKEKNLYAISDRIGCMSQANVDYVLKHNPEISPEKVEICPNSIEVQDMRISDDEKIEMRKKYGIPTDKKVFVYGGNLGKPQDIPFIIDCLRAEKVNDRVFFLIVGGGTEYGKLETFVNEEKPTNMKLMKRLPKDDYDRMVAACDVGMIFLDHHFTIPNFPSRLLSYMQAGLPVLACTDPNTDIGKVITDGGFGWWCESDDVKKFADTISAAIECNLSAMGENGMMYLVENYTVDKAYQTIMKNF